MKIAIIKYNAGNVQSVTIALERLGFEAVVTADKNELRSADKIIFPGVGHAGAAMNSLIENDLHTLIPTLTQPLLGICVGMQLLCKSSEESGDKCLGIIDAEVKTFPVNNGLKVPQMGWNNIYNYKDTILDGVPQDAYVYYVHSYFVENCKETIANTNYGIEYSAMVRKNNFYGVQFHTEKSANVGDIILKNFLLNT